VDKEEKKNCSDEKVLSWEGQRYVIALKKILLSSSNLQQSYVTSNFSSTTLQGKKENLTI
jgi:hypothetical protein